MLTKWTNRCHISLKLPWPRADAALIKKRWQHGLCTVRPSICLPKMGRHSGAAGLGPCQASLSTTLPVGRSLGVPRAPQSIFTIVTLTPSPDTSLGHPSKDSQSKSRWSAQAELADWWRSLGDIPQGDTSFLSILEQNQNLSTIVPMQKVLSVTLVWDQNLSLGVEWDSCNTVWCFGALRDVLWPRRRRCVEKISCFTEPHF